MMSFLFDFVQLVSANSNDLIKTIPFLFRLHFVCLSLPLLALQPSTLKQLNSKNGCCVQLRGATSKREGDEELFSNSV